MAASSNIEWTDATFNPWIGCTRVSPACDDCYAARSTPARSLGVAWGGGEPRRLTAAGTWALPRHWNDAHAEFFAQHGRRRRVFCASLADVFDNEVDNLWRADLWDLIEATPNLDWLLLTKRIGNVRGMANRWMDVGAWPRNVRLGITVVNQEEWDRDIGKLLRLDVPNFISLEPLLGAIDMRLGGASMPDHAPHRPLPRQPEWVIVGGESGPSARPMHPDWARSLRDQCAAAGVPFLFKQWGEWLPSEAEDQPVYRGEHRHLGGPVHAFRVGKKAAGRVLDGRTHDYFPGVAHA